MAWGGSERLQDLVALDKLPLLQHMERLLKAAAA
jgi:hypothetical protein